MTSSMLASKEENVHPSRHDAQMDEWKREDDINGTNDVNNNAFVFEASVLTKIMYFFFSIHWIAEILGI